MWCGVVQVDARLLDAYNKYREQQKNGVPEKSFGTHAMNAMGLFDPAMDMHKAQFDAMDHNGHDRIKLGDFQKELQRLVDEGLLSPSDVAEVMGAVNKRG